jgi:dTDP-glucose 4,6-dehydratase
MNKDVYLVTGGCGFIGSHVIDELVKNPSIKKIINIDNLGIGSDINNTVIDARVENFYVNICDEEIHSIFEKYKPGYILHLAAESHVDRSIADPLSFVSSNVVGTGNILECVRKYVPRARMVHVSTDEVYGHLEHDDYPFLEDTPISPRSPYSASKAGSDVLAFSYRTTYGLDITVTRCCNNYGPRQHNEKLIPTIFRTLHQGKKVPVYGDGTNLREWIYVSDHAKALIEILYIEDAKSVYNIWGKERFKNIDLIRKIIKHLVNINERYDRGYLISNYIDYVADRPGHDLCYKMGSIYNKIETLKNQIDFDDGIIKTLEYYRLKYEKKDQTAL